jgi:hypothetical protein
VPSNPDPKTSRVPLMGLLAALTVCLAAIPVAMPRQDTRGLGGTWLITLAFAGERPLLVELASPERNPLQWTRPPHRPTGGASHPTSFPFSSIFLPKISGPEEPIE